MKNIIFLGLVSFFADVSAEMVYPIVPLYLSQVFGATPALVGLIEGIAESLASLLKVFSGYLTDRFRRKKILAFAGYSTGVFYKLAMLLAGSWAGILGARVLDRLGKGLRTAPRDVMVAQSARAGGLGRAFGVHKALDMAGAALGILISALLLRKTGDRAAYHQVFLWSLVPMVLALGMFFFIKEKREDRGGPRREPFWRGLHRLDRQLKLYLAVATVFTLGNSSNAFLLLRARGLGFDQAQTIWLYFIYNITASLLSVPLGGLSDRVGRKRLLVAGYGLFALAYAGFGLAASAWQLIAAFVIYGVFTAMTTGVERAFIAQIAPPELKGTMLGLHGTLVGLALLPASLIAGLLWNGLGPAAPFLLGAALSLLAAVTLAFFFRVDNRIN